MDAFENLRTQVVDLEALADAAHRAADDLPYVREPAHRRAIGRLQSLVFILGASASAALASADADLAELADRDAGR